MRTLEAFAPGWEGAGRGRKSGGWARRPRPSRQCLCACAIRQLLVLSTRQPPPRSVRAEIAEVQLESALLRSSCESPSSSSGAKGRRPVELSLHRGASAACGKIFGDRADPQKSQRGRQRKCGPVRGAPRGGLEAGGKGGVWCSLHPLLARRVRFLGAAPFPAGLASGTNLVSPPPRVCV